MQEQFDLMKNSFIDKIKEIEEEFNEYKITNRKKLYNTTEELKQATFLKEIFLRQLTDYQKIYNIN